ncbi:MAG: response regulator transcription factor [Promethearchaeota archaeon]
MAKIFIVDDEPSLRQLYKKALQLNGFEIACIANNGEMAVSMFKSFLKKPEVILMDYRMPIKNGIDAAKEILQDDKHAKIIFTTADNSVNKEAFSNGVVNFMNKPFTIGQLIDNIKKEIKNSENL